MAILFSDDFSGYADGSDNPDGWVDLNGVFHGQVMSPNGLYGRSGKAYQFILGGPILWNGGTASNVTVNWVGAGHDGGFPQLMVGITTSSTSFTQPLVFVTMEADRTISLYAVSTNTQLFAGAHLLANSGSNAYVHDLTWQELQFAATCETVNLGTTVNIAVANMTVWYEGRSIITVLGPVVSTDIFDGVHSAFSGWQFSKNIVSPVADAFVTDVHAVDSVLSTWTAPFQGTGVVPAARVTQGVVEVQKLPGSTVRKARMTQGIIEITKLTDLATRHARMTQGVVEIIKRGKTGQAWRIYET